VLDISMPEMDGYEVARHLRALFQDRITLIALTANGSEDDRRKANDAGFNIHLIKPTDPEKLGLLLLELGAIVVIESVEESVPRPFCGLRVDPTFLL
jgi:CheY-like chemotaxis protein